GYTDIYMQRSHLRPDIPYEWVWEIKYIAKKRTIDNVLETTRKEARKQLDKYRNSAMFAGRNDIRYLSVIFIGKDKYEIEEI
ncbi:MAG: PD-(D/E)XK nuclease domain-containing protein, partial [Bacteroidales bacterium]|nr:PD-(D/E)XK nuclease domain-containing protein [Bacteroidales bacterium]